MGYTHYWDVKDLTVWAQIWPKLVSDANRIIEEANIELDEDWNHATVEEGIKVNGPEDYGHESFLLLPNKKGFDFCKTAQKPYDLVVTTILIRARMLAGAATFRLSSDGDDDEWTPAKNLYAGLWPDDVLPTVLLEE